LADYEFKEGFEVIFACLAATFDGGGDGDVMEDCATTAISHFDGWAEEFE
jgi:hypothetical protein